MAGDWIKMRVGLISHPRVLRIAECLLDDPDFLEWSGLSYGVPGFPAQPDSVLRAERHAALRVTRYVTVTALLRFWGYANEHAKGDSIAGVWQEDVDEITGVPGFAAALEAIEWATFTKESGGLTMPNFEEHNVSATVRSGAGAERQKRYRERKKAEESGDATRDVTVTEREEKRTEEKSNKKPPAPKGDDGFFERFWTAYPKKDAKTAARKAFGKLNPDAALVDRMLQAIEWQKRREQWTKQGGQFIPLPASWLNAARWEDARSSDVTNTVPTNPAAIFKPEPTFTPEQLAANRERMRAEMAKLNLNPKGAH